MTIDPTLIKVTDDYLPKEEFEKLRNYFLGNACYWYYCGNYSGGYPQMEHVFHNETVGPQRYAYTNTIADGISVLAPILETLNIACLVRIRAICNWRTDPNTMEQRDWHVDVPFDCTTAVYYLHDSDGKTIFKDDDNEPYDCETKANRLVQFPSSYQHSVTPFTQPDRRVLINFNYITPNPQESVFVQHNLVSQHPMK